MADSVNSRLEALRDLLAAASHPLDLWGDLCALFDRWPDAEDLAVGLAYAESHLQLADRHRVATHDWLFDATQGRQPRLRLCRSLEMGSGLYHANAWSSPDLAGIRVLRLVQIDVETHLDVLTGSAFWSALESLRIDDCDIDDEMLATLFPDVGQSSLLDVELPTNAITGVTVERLVGGRGHSLRRLDLSGNALGDEQPLGIASMVGRPFPELRHLDLARTHVDDEGCLVLADAELPALRSLDLASNSITLQGLVPLLDSLQCAPLRRLNLGIAGIDDQTLSRLASHPLLSGIEALDLPGNALGDEGALTLAESSRLWRLCELDLRGTGIGADGAAALARSGNLRHLGKLNLRGCRIGRRGQRALLDAGFTRSQGVGCWARPESRHSE